MNKEVFSCKSAKYTVSQHQNSSCFYNSGIVIVRYLATRNTSSHRRKDQKRLLSRGDQGGRREWEAECWEREERENTQENKVKNSA